MSSPVSAGRSREIMEAPRPRVGNLRFDGHSVYHLAGESVVFQVDLRGATVSHVVRRDLKEMTIGAIVTAVAFPLVALLVTGGCGIAVLVVGFLFCWIMWLEGHYLNVVDADGVEHEFFVADELSEELDFFILRILSEGLVAESSH